MKHRASRRLGMTHCCRKDMPPVGVTSYSTELRSTRLKFNGFPNHGFSLAPVWWRCGPQRNAAHCVIYCGRIRGCLLSEAHFEAHPVASGPALISVEALAYGLIRIPHGPQIVWNRAGIHLRIGVWVIGVYEDSIAGLTFRDLNQ